MTFVRYYGMLYINKIDLEVLRMFKLANSSGRFVLLRCQCCDNVEAFDKDYFETIQSDCVALKSNTEIICSKCQTVHTSENKLIPLEQQTFSHINIPTCPTCGSTNVSKITTTSKVVGFAAVGVFSSNFGKTMHCKQCGYKW